LPNESDQIAQIALMRLPVAAPGGSFKGTKRLGRMRRLIDRFPDAQTEISVGQLAQTLGTSCSTIRRDLVELEARGLVRRTHGGARRGDDHEEVPVILRASDEAGAKLLIARRAAALVSSSHARVVAVNGGTTTLEAVRALRYSRGMTFVTNSLPIAVEAAAWPTARVVVTGGVVGARSLEATGTLAEAGFNAIDQACAIVGADAVSAARGVSAHNVAEARAASALIASSRLTVVIAHGSKIGRTTGACFADIGQIDHLVTDNSADRRELKRIAALGAKVHVVAVAAAGPAA